MLTTARVARKMDTAPPHHPQAARSTRWRPDLSPPSLDLAHRRLTARSVQIRPRSGPDLARAAPATRAVVSRRCHPCGHLQPRTPPLALAEAALPRSGSSPCRPQPEIASAREQPLPPPRTREPAAKPPRRRQHSRADAPLAQRAASPAASTRAEASA
jgi:hypothetical protein